MLKDVARIFSTAGFECFLVGGAVRDMIAGFPTTDYDLATDARPEEVMKLFPRVVPTGIKHGTVTVLTHGLEMEVTTFRAESDYSDGRHPDRVFFSGNIQEDLSRRDFTMNALAVDLATSKLIDLHGGLRDIRHRTIRAIGDPSERFAEDGLRLLRACRFSSQLEFTVEPGTRDAMLRCREHIQNISAERIQDELVKTLSSREPSRALFLMDETGLLGLILPELESGKGVEQKGIHQFDVLAHSIYSCDGAPQDRIEIRLAALLHDIGKPKARAVGPDGMVSFHRHEEYSAEMAGAILRRLRFSNAVEERVCRLIRHHMFNYEENWNDSAVRRFVARVGLDSIDDLFLLRRADTYGAVGHFVDDRRLAAFRKHIDSVMAQESALSLSDLVINGNDLAQIGIPRGPIMGRVLGEILETVLDDPSMNRRDVLLDVARRFYERHVKELEPR